MIKHDLKALPGFFLEVCAGLKTFEIRIDDRDIQVGDTIVLHEWSNETGYTGRKTRELNVTYTLRDCPAYGLATGYCIFCWNN